MLRDIGFGAFYDANTGLAYLRDEDSGALRSTGFTFENVTTFGPLAYFWPNNPIQFATERTAEAIKAIVQVRYPARYLLVIVEQEKATGPFRWTPQRMIEFNDTDGTRVEINAGELANQIARAGKRSALDVLSDTLKLEFASKRAQERD